MKSKIFIIVISVLLIIILFLGGFIIYDKFITKDLDNKNSEKIDEEVTINDKFALSIETLYEEDTLKGTRTMQVYFLDNGNLYYKIINEEQLNSEMYYTYDFYGNNTNKLNKFTKLTNIKRIKGANTISSGVAFNLLLITEEGKVYELIYDLKGFILNEARDFKDYKIDDILEYEPVNSCLENEECKPSYKIQLLDGKIITQ